MTNSVDPDQMLHSAASDLGLHCLQRPICPNTLVITVNLMQKFNQMDGWTDENIILI